MLRLAKSGLIAATQEGMREINRADDDETVDDNWLVGARVLAERKFKATQLLVGTEWKMKPASWRSRHCNSGPEVWCTTGRRRSSH